MLAIEKPVADILLFGRKIARSPWQIAHQPAGPRRRATSDWNFPE
jgi:hypothetical protein